MWTPWGPGGVYCIERCPHFSGSYIGLLYIKKASVLSSNTEASVIFQGRPLRGVPLHAYKQ